MTLAPPSSFGAARLIVAIPGKSIATDVIEGASGGPRGLSHNAVVYNFGLQALPVLIISIFDLLLIQVLSSTTSDPGVPDGAAPF